MEPEVHYRVHKSRPLATSLIQTNPIHILTYYLFKVILILSSNLRLRLLSCLLLQVVPRTPSIHRGGPDSILGRSMWDLWWTKWHWDRFSPQSTSVFPCQFHSTGATLLGKTKKLIIFITGLHNKP
jgi:hypothetical protein